MAYCDVYNQLVCFVREETSTSMENNIIMPIKFGDRVLGRVMCL